MIHYVCKYTPLELFGGFGEPCAMVGQMTESFELSDSLSHPNLCGFGKSLLQNCVEHHVKSLVLVNCCDTIRRTYDVLKRQGEMDFLFLLDLPHCQTNCSLERMQDELLRLIEEYAAFSGKTFDGNKFAASFAPPTPIPTEDYLCVMGARIGDALYDSIQKICRMPVENHTCMGNRNVLPPSKLECSSEWYTAQWMSWYARVLLNQMPCMRMSDVTKRRLLLNSPHLKGIIYHTMKFCDYYGFEYESLKSGTSLPLLKIESDYTPQSEGQLRTRIEAFAETLSPEQLHSGVTGGKNMKDKQYVAGIDSGSTSTNAVILDRDKNIIGTSIVLTGARAAQGAEKALETALSAAGIKREDLDEIVSTGYGRANITHTGKDVTEITCHAKGAYYLNPRIRTIIDIGGQDSKVIRIDESGAVKNFVMNDKCAAGTGRFLELMARTLELTLEEMSEVGLAWKKDVVISSMCTVFAESEVVSLIAQNTATADIVHGLNNAVASKTISLVNRVGKESEYIMTGGVAQNKGVVRAIEERLGEPLCITNEAQLCGALGAALIALEG